MTSNGSLRSVVLCSAVFCSTMAALGCGDGPPPMPTLHDDIGIALDEGADSMEAAYAVGSRFRVRASRVQDGWRLESGDASVLALTAIPDAERALEHDATALAEGATVVRVLDDSGAILHEVGVVVRRADRVERSIDGDRLDPSAPAPRIVVGGPVLVRVALFAGETALAARGLVEAPAGSDRASFERVTLGRDEGVRVTASSAGPLQLALLGASDPAGHVALDVVPQDVIASIGLDRLDAASDGATGFLRAHARDALGSRIYGPGFTWTLDAQPLSSSDDRRDLFAYTRRDDAEPRTLVASFGPHQASTAVAFDGSPTLLRGSDLTCSTGPGSVPLGVVVWGGVLLVASIAAVRRLAARKRIAARRRP